MKTFFCLLLLSTQVFAQLENNLIFKKQGKKVVTEITTSNYIATRDLLYYIPDSVDLAKPTTVVVYLHGGNSNMEQSRATETAETLFWGTVDGFFSKKSGIKSIADDQQFIVVMPTTTSGWNDFTPHYMKELLAIIRKELNPDPNKIFLLGHSMGAMGICRGVSHLADEFAMFLPMSGGFQPHLKRLHEVGPFFNTNVWVTVGAKYDFNDFRLWNDDFEKFLTNESVTSFFRSSKKLEFVYEIHPGDHNPNLPVMTERLGAFLKDVERQMYQPEIFGTVYTSRPSETYIKRNEIKRYFWLEARSFREMDPTENSISATFRLYSKNNIINLYVDRGNAFIFDVRPHLKNVRLHLSEKLFNLDMPIKINLITKRGASDEMSVVFEGIVPRNNSASLQMIKESGDKGLVFEAFVDIDLPRN